VVKGGDGKKKTGLWGSEDEKETPYSPLGFVGKNLGPRFTGNGAKMHALGRKGEKLNCEKSRMGEPKRHPRFIGGGAQEGRGLAGGGRHDFGGRDAKVRGSHKLVLTGTGGGCPSTGRKC